MSGLADHLTILLVEDNPGDRRLAEIAMQEACSDAQIRCGLQMAGTLAEALSRLGDSQNCYDAVLLDLGLPDAKGLDGLRAARAAKPNVPIIVLTGLSDLVTATEALKFGASDYLEKAEVQPRPLLRSIRYAIERKKSEGELVHLANTDPLTGLLNRRAFFEQLRRALADARRTGLACALLIIDVDHFKEINDLYGHETGDILLSKVARTLEGQIRETDSVARLGGDEFAVLAAHIGSASAAITIAEKIGFAVRSIVDLNDTTAEASVSIGISVFPIDDAEVDEFVSHADVALYKAKTVRRGSINFYDATMDAEAKAEYALKLRMPEDIANSRLFLNFQPIVDANTGAIAAAEGLARWRNENGELIPPSEFIPLAENSGLISMLALHLLEEACGCLRRWIDAGLEVVPISMNVSPVQFRDPTFGLQLVKTLEKFRIPPSLINIEITELTITNNTDVTRDNLQLMKSLGIAIHIDDFGTGYSSLSLLNDLAFDVLKIDRSFVSRLGTGARSEAIVQAVIELAVALGLKTIAEGVETEAQALSLTQSGVDFLQGYLFSRPVPADQFASLLKTGIPDASATARLSATS